MNHDRILMALLSIKDVCNDITILIYVLGCDNELNLMFGLHTPTHSNKSKVRNDLISNL